MKLSQKIIEKAKAILEARRGNVNTQVTYLIGAVIVIVMATALAPDIFSNISSLNTTDAPTWVRTVLLVVAGAGLVFLIWRTFGNK